MAIVSVRQAGLGGFTKNRRLSYTFPSTMGMVLLSPTSIAFSGTSASIGANGQVTFTAVTSLSLNGVFSADYDNYVVAQNFVAIGANLFLYYRLRAAGTDASGNNYTRQYLSVDNTTLSAGRISSTNYGWAGYGATTLYNLSNINLYGPYLAQPTAVRTVTTNSASSAQIYDSADTHSLSTSYDGISIIPASSSITGKLAVYGVRS